MEPCPDFDDGCRCYACGYRAGMEAAVENAYRSTMAETQYKRIEADRDYWRRKYEEVTRGYR